MAVSLVLIPQPFATLSIPTFPRQFHQSMDPISRQKEALTYPLLMKPQGPWIGFLIPRDKRETVP